MKLYPTKNQDQELAMESDSVFSILMDSLLSIYFQYILKRIRILLKFSFETDQNQSKIFQI